ncbi:YxeA family protein [Clostridium sp. LIBA-8841]|uniref:YxeA family protein n=1 Tax=Clostridium sp. LIBA-8841 TaxID=2987530 RepID=UPI002AC624E4|nr:YxeA family protein [Clostridium sp. LIBA-8841]MDZ5252752.1 YxeA family protein [Clostridium sp. LIBA-8841]
MKYIKRLIIGIFAVSMLSGMIGCTRLNEINTEKFYVKIIQDGKEHKEPYIRDGEKKDFIYYQYEDVSAYDKDGKGIKVRFSSDKKQLRKDAYLEIRVKDVKDNSVNEITSYEEVKPDEVPSAAKAELDK